MLNNCSYCGKEYRDPNGSIYCEKHREYDSRPSVLTIKQNIQVLKNLRKYILKHDVECYNSDVIGDKYNECTWGMCNKQKEVWNKKEYHSWPYSFTANGRISPLDIVIRCHYDKPDPEDPEWLNGCLYRCKAFMKGVPSREDTIEMIDKIIEQYKNKSS